MSKKIARIIAMLLALVMSVGLTACNGNEESGDSHKITYWLCKGEDTSFYDDYEDNPVYKYIEENYTFNGKKLEIDFVVAPPGGEKDDFSTLYSTGEYCGVMDMNMASMTIAEMYEDGILWDLTELVPQYMPNYMKYLEENPGMDQYLYSYVNGEKKILAIRGYKDSQEPNFEGYCYRRDWIVKYGTHPVTGEAFTGGYTDPDDYLSWEDNVVFPNGTSEPLYISDWEWMFEIFTKAMKAEGITDGYCFAPYYVGYMQTGDLASGFGGGAPYWYMDGDTVVDGFVSDNMRAYLQCLNTWYNNGWLDESFDEHSSDMFYAIDSASVFQGKVGLWQGRISTVGNQIETGEDDYTKGIMVFGCKQPINDIYGGDEQKYVEPNMLWQFDNYDGQVVLTDKLSEEEVIAFLEMVDFFFTEEGFNLVNFGLTQEMYEQTNDEFYTRLGLTNGLHYTETQADGTILHKFNIDTSANEFMACIYGRIVCKLGAVKNVDKGYDRYLSEAVANWDYYKNTAKISYLIESNLTVEQNQQITKINASLDQFKQRTVPEMIKGKGYDIWDDASWAEFVKAVNKYRAQNVTDIYQSVLDSLN